MNRIMNSMTTSTSATVTASRRLRRRLTTTATTNNDDHIIMATRNWFERIVLGDTLCPFAPRRPELLRMVVTSSNDVVETVSQEVQFLFHSKNPIIHETTLVILKNQELEFLELIRLSWACQEHAIDGTDLVDQVQLVLFHPRATHQTYQDEENEDDPRDYTIRSPYPTIHLLREQDVMRAVTSGYPQLETLPQRNKQKMVTQGLDQCQSKLRDCYLTSK